MPGASVKKSKRFLHMATVLSSDDSFASLRIPDFRYFVMNSFLITATMLIQEVVLGYELYKMTHDPLALGLVGLAEAIPFIALSLFGGHLADRRDKKRILQWSLLVITLGSVILYFMFQPLVVSRLSQTAQLATIYGVLMLIGTAKGFYSPASSSLKPFLVPRELYANSATWYSSFWQIGAITGPGVAGFLYSGLGFDNTLLVVIGLQIVCFLLITLVSRHPVPVSDSPVLGFRESLKEGFQFVFNTPIVLYAISLDLFSVLFGGVVAILPVFAEDILKVGAEGLGVLRAAPSIGAVLTLAYMTKHPPTNNAWRNMLLAVAGFGVATIIFSQSTNFYLSVLMLALTGAFDSVSVIIRQTIMQIFPPDHLRGRVAAVNGIFVSSSNEIGAFESGLMARLLGTTPSVLVGGVFTLVALGYIYTKSKSLLSVKIN
jgi:MFS family permease